MYLYCQAKYVIEVRRRRLLGTPLLMTLPHARDHLLQVVPIEFKIYPTERDNEDRAVMPALGTEVFRFRAADTFAVDGGQDEGSPSPPS